MEENNRCQGPGAGGRRVHFHLKLTRARSALRGGRGGDEEKRGSESPGWSNKRESDYAGLRVCFSF